MRPFRVVNIGIRCDWCCWLACTISGIATSSAIVSDLGTPFLAVFTISVLTLIALVGSCLTSMPLSPVSPRARTSASLVLPSRRCLAISWCRRAWSSLSSACMVCPHFHFDLFLSSPFARLGDISIKVWTSRGGLSICAHVGHPSDFACVVILILGLFPRMAKIAWVIFCPVSIEDNRMNSGLDRPIGIDRLALAVGLDGVQKNRAT